LKLTFGDSVTWPAYVQHVLWAFLPVSADGRSNAARPRYIGGYHATFGVMLPSGDYEVRFFVKDRSDYKIVLHHDFFKFTVE
jgi:hypothetical protein